MNTSQGPDFSGPVGYRAASRRRWPIVVGLAVVGLAASVAYVAVAPQVYTATASVTVRAVAQPAEPGAGIVLIPDRLVPDLRIEAQVVQSTGVATLAGHMMHSALTPWQLAQQVVVTVPPNSAILDIACSASTASGAAVCANDFANAYLTTRQDTAVAYLTSSVHTLNGKAAYYAHQAAAFTTKANSLPSNSATRAQDKALAASDRAQANKYSAAAGTAGGQLADTDGGSINTVAIPPASPASPSKLLVLPGGLVAGLLVGLITAFLLGRRDKRTHGARRA